MTLATTGRNLRLDEDLLAELNFIVSEEGAVTQARSLRKMIKDKAQALRERRQREQLADLEALPDDIEEKRPENLPGIVLPPPGWTVTVKNEPSKEDRIEIVEKEPSKVEKEPTVLFLEVPVVPNVRNTPDPIEAEFEVLSSEVEALETTPKPASYHQQLLARCVALLNSLAKDDYSRPLGDKLLSKSAPQADKVAVSTMLLSHAKRALKERAIKRLLE